MIKKIHKKYHNGELNLRDYLAAYRTVLSNERTWMSNTRTALTFLVASVTFVKLFESPTLIGIGYMFMPIGVIIFLIGSYHHYKRRKMFEQIRESDEFKKEFCE